MDVSEQSCHDKQTVNTNPLTQKQLKGDKETMSSQSIKNWKLGIFGVVALMLIAGLFGGTAIALDGSGTVDIISGFEVVAGSEGNTVRANFTAAEDMDNGEVFFGPPSDLWTPMQLGNAGSPGFTTVVNGSGIANTTEINGGVLILLGDFNDGDSLTVTYGSGGGASGATASPIIGIEPMIVQSRLNVSGVLTGIADETSLEIEVTGAGSGRIEVDTNDNDGDGDNTLSVKSGASGKIFEFQFFAPGEGDNDAESANSGDLNGATLILTIPSPFPPPQGGNQNNPGFIEFDIPDFENEDEETLLGGPDISGNIVTIPIIQLIDPENLGNDNDEDFQFTIKYRNVTVPQQTGDFTFNTVVVAPNGDSRPIADPPIITIEAAGEGSGTATAEGGPVSANSIGNIIRFVYTAEGTIIDGALDVEVPDGWSRPQGAPGTAGNTIVHFGNNPQNTEGLRLGFNDEGDFADQDFVDDRINVQIDEMFAGDTIEIVYGSGGGDSGAEAGDPGRAVFKFRSRSKKHDDEVLTEIDRQPRVNVHVTDGSGTARFEADDGVTPDVDDDTKATARAGDEITVQIVFVAEGTMDGGSVSLDIPDTMDNGGFRWPPLTNDNIEVMTSGSVSEKTIAGPTVTVPVKTLSATQTITFRYKEVIGPIAPGTDEFIVKSSSTANGALTQLSLDPDEGGKLELETKQAADGSGMMTVRTDPAVLTAGELGANVWFTFVADGRMDGGAFQIEFPPRGGWPAPEESKVKITSTTGATYKEFTIDTGDPSITVEIDEMDAGEDLTVRFGPTGIPFRASATIAANPGFIPELPFTIRSQGDGFADGDDRFDDVDTLLNSLDDGDDDNDEFDDGPGELFIPIRHAADGSGTATVEIPSGESSVNAVTPDQELVFIYKAIGDMGDGARVKFKTPLQGDWDLPVPRNLADLDEAFGDTDAVVNVQVRHLDANDNEIALIGPTHEGFDDLGFFGNELEIPIDDLDPPRLGRGEKIEIRYRTTTPNFSGTFNFEFESQGRRNTTDDDDPDITANKDDHDRKLVGIADDPEVVVGNAPDGTGTAKIEPDSAIGGTKDVEIVVTYTSAGPIVDGELEFRVPNNNWTDPGNNPGQSGYTTITSTGQINRSNISFSGPSVFIPLEQLAADDTVVIRYGSGGGNSGVRIPAAATDGTDVDGNDFDRFEFFIESIDRGEEITEQPTITIRPLAGSGTMTANPPVIDERRLGEAGAETDFSFIYTAEADIVGGDLILSVPNGWTSPQDLNDDTISSGDPGATSSTKGTLSISSDKITIDELDLDTGQTVRIDYRNAKPPEGVVGDEEFETTLFLDPLVNADGGPISPAVAVVSQDGSGTFALFEDGDLPLDIDGNVIPPTDADFTTYVNEANERGAVFNEESNAAGVDQFFIAFTPNTRGFDGSGVATGSINGFLKNGEISIEFPNGPKGWSPPEIGGTKGTVSFVSNPNGDDDVLDIVGRTLRVRLKEMTSDAVVVIKYGGEDKADVQKDTGDPAEFTVRSQLSAGGSLDKVFSNQKDPGTTDESFLPVRVINAESGSGEISVTPTSVNAGSENRMTFTFTATGEMDDGAIRITPPTGTTWSDPGTTANTAGRVTSQTSSSRVDSIAIETSTTPNSFTVNINRLAADQSITIHYGGTASDEKAVASQTPTDGKAGNGFTVATRGGSSVDGFVFAPLTSLDDDDNDPGNLPVEVTNAADGSGTVVKVSVDPDPTRAATKDNTLTFDFTAAGPMDGGGIRLSVPAGWSDPTVTTTANGHTSANVNFGKKAFGNTFELDLDTMVAGQTIRIIYGDSKGAESPLAAGDSEFIFQTKASADGSFKTSDDLKVTIPVENAQSGTGDATLISGGTLNSGSGDNNLTVEYTAGGTLDDGDVRFTLPGTFTPDSEEEEGMVGAKQISATTDGKIKGKADWTVGDSGRQVTIPIEELAANQRVTVTWAKLTAPDAGAAADPADPLEVELLVESNGGEASDPFAAIKKLDDDGNPDPAGDSLSPKVKILAAKDGTGSVVANRSVVRPGENVGESGGLVFTYTIAGTITKKGEIRLTIPDGWTPPDRDLTKDGAFDVRALDAGGSDITSGLVEKDLSGRELIARIGGDDADRLEKDQTIVFTYGANDQKAEAPSTDAPAISPFGVRQKSTEDGTLTNVKTLNVIRSSEGNGAGAMVVGAFADKSAAILSSNDGDSSVVGASNTILRFTYTAAEKITGGAISLTLPPGWAEPKDRVDTDLLGVEDDPTLGPIGSIQSVETDGQTIKVNVSILNPKERVVVFYGIEEDDGDENLGTAQNNAGAATFVSKSRVGTSGDLEELAVNPTLEVKNVAAGTGDASIEGGPVASGSSGNELTFRFTAEGTMDGGGIKITPPSGWSDPQREPGQPGYTTATSDGSIRNIEFPDGSVVVNVNQLAPDEKITVVYGRGSGSSGVTAQSNIGAAVFDINSKTAVDGDFAPISPQPSVRVDPARDGAGTMTVSRNTVTAGERVTLAFDYTVQGTIRDGAVRLSIPPGWSQPNRNSGQAGFTEASVTPGATIGTPQVSNRDITIPVPFLTTGQTLTITYGSSGGSSRAIVQPTTEEDVEFIPRSQGSATGVPVVLFSAAPSVDVTGAGDGSGNATRDTTPSTLTAGSSGNTIRITYTADGPMINGNLALDVPQGWSQPNSQAGVPGYTDVESPDDGQIGDVTFDGNRVTIPIINLEAEDRVRINYGKNGGASGVTVQGMADPSVQLTVSSQGSAVGSLVPLTSGSPTVPVTNARDGSGTATISPTNVLVSSTGNDLRIRYRAVGTMNGGVVQLRIPPSWTPASDAPDTPGHITVSSESGVVVGAPLVSPNGGSVTVELDTLGQGQTFDVFYSDATAPDDLGESVFVVKARGTGAGDDTDIANSPRANIVAELPAQPVALSLSSAGPVFVDDSLEVTVELLDDEGNPATSTSDVAVTTSSSSDTGTFSEAADGVFTDPLTVTIPAGDTSIDVFYKDATAGAPLLTATAPGLTDDTTTVTVTSKDVEVVVITSVSVSSSIAKAGDTVMVWADGTPGKTATFSTVDGLVNEKEMTEDEAGSYHGDFTVVADQHPEGVYDVTVNLKGDSSEDSLTKADALEIDDTAPTITELEGAQTGPVSNGETFSLAIDSESGLTMEADVSGLDTTQTDPIPLTEDSADPGLYSADVTISEDNTAPNGERDVVVTASDAAGNTASLTIGINLQNGLEYTSTIPEGISLFHVPLDVESIDGAPTSLETVGDLFDALGDDVGFLITYDSGTGSWNSFLGAGSRGGSADQPIEPDTGMITVMNREKTLTFGGNAWDGGSSTITLDAGLNVKGLPVDDPSVENVSDIMGLLGFDGKISSIIVSEVDVATGETEFMVVVQPDDSGDGPVKGDAAYIITGTEPSTAATDGVGWSNSGVSGAAPIALIGHRIDGQTPVLFVQGAIVDEITGLVKEGFRIKVKNLSTKASLSTISSRDTADSGYHMTFVDTTAGNAARVGDVLEISVDSPDPLIGVQPLRHIVTTDDVKKSRIQLEELIAYEIPAETELLRNYPNPFNPETWIPFRLAEDAVVTLTIYDTAGRAVRSIDVGHKPAAVYESRAKAIYWDGRNDFGERVASGVYFYNLSAGDFSGTRKMLILK